ncbi:helix-turn-helix domain-containing protein [Pararobbsia alpina]|uniref:HTH lysR-type domain-containing protein n=1 Tax=Pararobbsia alpina TaxID=621374 RepID=A0A6S7B9J5_9BURK|nr:LysR family transcriptional regulator [Pararobbsia alpina]CAB3790588.1 hypothetical protein LMG28138_03018 [Pararobbsia alpina]
MDRLDALKLFIRIVDGGSFAAAAREIGVGQPAVSTDCVTRTVSGRSTRPTNVTQHDADRGRSIGL